MAVKGKQVKSKYEKLYENSNSSFFTLHIYTLKIMRAKTRFLLGFMIGKSISFYALGNSPDSSHSFSTWSSEILSCWSQYNISIDSLLFGEAIETGF